MKKGFLFSFDSLLAAIILIGGLLLIGAITERDTDTSQIATASQDTIIALNTIRMYEIDHPWVKNEILNGDIVDVNVSVLEQIGYYWAQGDQNDATQLAEILLNDTLTDFGIRLTFGGQSIYERNGTKGAENVLSASQMISGVTQGEAVKGTSASAYLKRIEDKRNFVLLPFGGFVGEGNISILTTDIPSDANVTDIIIEVDGSQPFNFVINGAVCDLLSPSTSFLTPSAWNRTNCTSLVDPLTTNTFGLNFSGTINGSYVAGGYVKVVYTTDQFSSVQDLSLIYRFPHIEGLINLFDGFYVDGNISDMNMTLHFLSNYTSYLTIGNASWTFVGSTSPQIITFNESQMQSAISSAGLSYDGLSSKTIPLRFGIGSVVILGTPSDTIVVTDTSGSMDDCVDPSCTPPGDQKKIDAAINATNNFISFMLNNTGVYMGLVEFSSSIKSDENLTDNETKLKNEVSGYTASGGTCICCGVNRAVQLLSGNSLVVPRSSSGWRYNTDDLGSPPAGWNTLGFDDSGWSTGTTAIGWFYGSINTNIGCCSNWYIGDYYHRKRFNVTNATDIQNASLFVRSDDGADVYLNGVLIDNDYSNSHSAIYWNRNSVVVDPGLLNEGENIIAVRQWHGTNWWNPMAFDLELAVGYTENVTDPRTKNMVVMSDGETNDQCSEQGTGTAKGDAIQAACDAYVDYGITVYTVGFGSDADVDTLQSMANCTPGEYFDATNASALNDAFGIIANAIIDSSSTQASIIEGDITKTILYGDSMIQANYSSAVLPPQPNEISVTIQTPPLANCSDITELHSGARFLSAFINSYSGDFWTDRLSVNGARIYNLSEYASGYASLGDPYQIRIPTSALVQGNNTFSLNIANDPSNVSPLCSVNNTVVYSIAINLSTERTDAVPNAEGCTWTVQFEDNSTSNFTIPSSYPGGNNCSYTETNISYDESDAYQLGAYLIFSRLDFKSTGKLFVNLNEEDLEIIVTTISGVPYMWGPTIARLEVTR